jgi:acyl-CoA thioesterase I
MIEARGEKKMMNEQSRRLHKQDQSVGKQAGGDHHQRAMVVIILSAFGLFCLGIGGCDGQTDVPTVISEPLTNGSEALLPPPQLLRAPNSAEPLARNATSIPKIVAFGDSLTAGFGVPPEESYPAQLARRLQQEGFNYEVINAGVSGETSAGGVRRVEWVLRSQPAIVILELGVNDGLRGLPLQQTYTNLRTIIKRLKEEEVVIILAGMRIPVNYGEEYTAEFSSLYERLAQEFDVLLIPFFLEGVAAHSELNQRDGVHPTAEGYTIVTQNVWRTLEPILTEWSEPLSP